MTTTRDPLAVLREVLALLESTIPTPLNLPGETNEHPVRVSGRIGEYREAIAQVEALALSVQNAVAAYYDSDDAPNWKAIANDLRLTVQPFTPGQDSQKCGCTQIDYIKGRACKSCVEAQEGQDSEGGDGR